MLPVLLELGPIKLHTYGFMIAVGFLVVLHVVRRDAERAGYDPEVFTNLAFWVLPLGIAGTRLAHILLYPQFYSWDDPIGWIAIWRGGLVFQGALPVGIAVAYIFFRRNKIPFLAACDLILPYLPLGHAFGRIGCFAYGCCYGKLSDLPWAIPARRVPWDTSQPPVGSPAFMDHLNHYPDITGASHWSHAIHPTQLYSAVGLLCICAILLQVRKRWPNVAGVTLPAYLFIYGVFRFGVEFLRGDHNPVHIAGISDQQVFSLVVAGLALVFWVILARRAPEAPTKA